jgi:hypothetical protein
MNLKQAQEILEPYNIVILFDDALKLFKVFLGASVVYISKQDMKDFDVPGFKTAIAHCLMQEHATSPRITLQ